MKKISLIVAASMFAFAANAAAPVAKTEAKAVAPVAAKAEVKTEAKAAPVAAAKTEAKAAPVAAPAAKK